MLEITASRNWNPTLRAMHGCQVKRTFLSNLGVPVNMIINVYSNPQNFLPFCFWSLNLFFQTKTFIGQLAAILAHANQIY